MTTRPLSIVMFLGLVLSVALTPMAANTASCSGACNPDNDEGCNGCSCSCQRAQRQ